MIAAALASVTETKDKEAILEAIVSKNKEELTLFLSMRAKD